MIDEYDLQRMARLLAASAKMVYTSCLVGNPAPAVARRLELLTHPRPGDLVLEISALGLRGREPVIGRLIGKARLPIERAEWSEATDGPLPSDDYWFIETLTGELQKWENCEFIRILEDWNAERLDQETDVIPIYPGRTTMDRKAWVKDARLRHGLWETLREG